MNWHSTGQKRFQKIKKDIYSYNNTDAPESNDHPSFLEIALHMLDSISSDRAKRRFFVLPETGYKIISHLAIKDEIKIKFDIK